MTAIFYHLTEAELTAVEGRGRQLPVTWQLSLSCQDENIIIYNSTDLIINHKHTG